jgi:hypothetical protein
MKDWLYREKKIKFTKHKYYNLQFGKYTDIYEKTNIFESSFKITKKCDHAGLKISIQIFNIYLFFDIYDNRHRCYVCDDWMTEKCYEEKHDKEI